METKTYVRYTTIITTTTNVRTVTITTARGFPIIALTEQYSPLPIIPTTTSSFRPTIIITRTMVYTTIEADTTISPIPEKTIITTTTLPINTATTKKTTYTIITGTTITLTKILYTTKQTTTINKITTTTENTTTSTVT